MDQLDHPAVLPPEQLLADCQLRRFRRRGPGGQHRNKVETAVVLVHIPTGTLGEASERRSQRENRKTALFRLRVNLALGVRTLRPKGSPVSAGWQSRRRQHRISINPAHDDFPALLAEALDVLASYDMQIQPAAQQLGITASQLIKFLKLQPRALKIINDRRRELNLAPVR